MTQSLVCIKDCYFDYQSFINDQWTQQSRQNANALSLTYY